MQLESRFIASVARKLRACAQLREIFHFNFINEIDKTRIRA